MVLTLNTCITKHSKKEKECLEVFDPTFPFADSGWPFPGWGPPRLTTQNRWEAAEETTPASSDLSTPLIYQNQSVQLVPKYVQLVPQYVQLVPLKYFDKMRRLSILLTAPDCWEAAEGTSLSGSRPQHKYTTTMTNTNPNMQTSQQFCAL